MYYDNIKNLLINNEIVKKVKISSINRSDLTTYLAIGKLLKEAGKHYGEGIIKKYADKLTIDLGKRYSLTTLKYMRLFYDFSKSHSLSDELTYTHYKYLLPLKNRVEVDYYIEYAKKHRLSARNLQKLIKDNYYERLSSNTKDKLINNKSLNILDEVKDTIIIKNNKINIESISEKYLQELIIDNIVDFMKQLGDSYSFIDREYPIMIGHNYNYIDILLFNIKYNCYVVVELKVTELKKEHIGQIQVYMNYIDSNIKNINHDKTIGLIIVKENNQYIIKYSSDERIKASIWSTYET